MTIDILSAPHHSPMLQVTIFASFLLQFFDCVVLSRYCSSLIVAGLTPSDFRTSEYAFFHSDSSKLFVRRYLALFKFCSFCICQSTTYITQGDISFEQSQVVPNVPSDNLSCQQLPLTGKNIKHKLVDTSDSKIEIENLITPLDCQTCDQTSRQQ